MDNLFRLKEPTEFRVWLKPQELVVNACGYHREGEHIIFFDNKKGIVLILPVEQVERVIHGNIEDFIW